MSRRKSVVAGKRWATDRRTTRRYFLFAPRADRRIAQAFWYCLGFYGNKYNIELYAALLMSTHPHLVYADPDGNQPLFKRDFHRTFAGCVKAILGWPEEVFNKSKGGEHEPLTAEALVRAIAYLIANPASAFAVRFSRDWPGPRTRARDIGRLVMRVKRPDCYLDPNNAQWPDEVEVTFVMPALLEETYGAEEARRRIDEEVRRLEREAAREAEERGITFRGVRGLMRIAHTARARSYEAFGSRDPQFSAAGDREAARAKVAQLRAFNADYDRALAFWMAGDRRRAVFPYGTWWMRVHHGARCRPPP